MTLFLYCVFDLFTYQPAGLYKYKLIHMTPEQYEQFRDIEFVEGKKPAVKLCRKAFGGTADSAWITTLAGQAELEKGFGPFIETEVPCPLTTTSQSVP